MKISIAIPTRNGSQFIDETLASILRQSRLPDELIISDDASHDETVSTVERFAQSAPFSVRVVAHAPDGITSNYLNALSQSTGDVVVFADQDDVWLPEKLRLIERAFLSSPQIAIVSTDSEIVDANLQSRGKTLRGNATKSAMLAKRVNSGQDVEHAIRGLPLLAHTLAIRSECRPVILNKPSLPAAWWFESWVSMVALAVGRLALVPEALTLYRQHAAQVAGAPTAHGLPRAATADYRDAAVRYSYVAALMRDATAPSLIDAGERIRRLRLVEAYVEFLDRRCNLFLLPRVARLPKIITPKMLSDYGRFASGAKSVARDCLRARETDQALSSRQ